MTGALALTVAFACAAAPGSPSALEQASGQLAEVVGDKHFEPPVGVWVDGPARPLARALASLVISKLAAARLAPVPVEARDPAEAERAARVSGARSLVRLTAELEGPKLVVRGDALGTGVNFWSGRVPTRSGPAAALALAVVADAQAVMLGGGPPAAAAPMELALRAFARLPQVPAALAMADLDGDHRAEILVMVKDRLWVLGAGGKVLARAELSGPPAAHPSREPFGAIAVSGGRIVAWSSRREKPEAFEGGLLLRSAGVVDGLALDGVGVAPELGFNRFLPEVTVGGRPVTLPGAFQAISAVGGLGLVCFADGTGALSKGSSPPSRLGGIGTGSALADLDGDGTPEVVATSARTVGELDEVRVVSLGAFEAAQGRGGGLGEVAPLWQQALKGRAVVAAKGDLDGHGTEAVVLGLWQPDGTGELLVLERVSP